MELPVARVDRGRGLRKGAAGGLLRGEGQRSDPPTKGQQGIAGNSRSTKVQGRGGGKMKKTIQAAYADKGAELLEEADSPETAPNLC